MKRCLTIVAVLGFVGPVAMGAGGFEPLFGPDGVSKWKVSDWSDVQIPQKVDGAPWKLENGVLYGLNKRTWLTSPDEYSDFTLKLETMISRGANGGIGLRFPPAGDPAYTGMEIQVVDQDVYYAGYKTVPEQYTGSIYDEIAPTGATINPPGQWNSWEITCKGSRVQISINGKMATDVDLSRQIRARQSKGPALSKRPLKGHIGFQNLNGAITIRNAQIKSLDGGDGFVDLFNGRDLSGWVNVNCAPQTWQVQDGMIVCSGVPTGVLRTERMYENYILELDYMHLKPGGNAGLFLNSAAITAPGQPFTKAIEVQILDGQNTDNYTSHGDVFAIHGATLKPDKPHPAGWMRALPTERRARPAGQWNHYRVENRNGDIDLAVNGKVVTRAHEVNPRKGYICLESEGGLVHYRNIRIKELPSTGATADVTAVPDEGFKSLYNGLDLTGWKVPQASEGHWVAKDWVLDYDGKSTAADKNLWTEKQYRDFVLIVDWRQPRKPVSEEVPVIQADGSEAVDADGKPKMVEVMDAGDSGIYLRGSEKSQINIWNWPVGSGEIWGYRTDRNMPAEVRKAATPLTEADNPPGRWNRFEITVEGQKVTVVLNGKKVIDGATLPDMPARGPIGLQHHGDPIQFANIYIKQLD